jgi:hypothetical protein
MAGLQHDFLLLSSLEHTYVDYMKWINNPGAVQIHDDVLTYIQDTLSWITCYNPAKRMMKHKGLNFCGPTVIKKDGAADAANIFSAWANLFSVGPKMIELTGNYGWIEGKNKETGSYSKINIDRDAIVEIFKELAEFSRQVAESEDKLFILHLGI